MPRSELVLPWAESRPAPSTLSAPRSTAPRPILRVGTITPPIDSGTPRVLDLYERPVARSRPALAVAEPRSRTGRLPGGCRRTTSHGGGSQGAPDTSDLRVTCPVPHKGYARASVVRSVVPDASPPRRQTPLCSMNSRPTLKRRGAGGTMWVRVDEDGRAAESHLQLPL